MPLNISYLSELSDGRIPEGATKCVGYWKAEFKKIAFLASEYILGGLLPEVHYHITIVRITEIIFNTGRNGMH